MIIAIAIATDKQLMQTIHKLTPDDLADEHIAEHIAGFELNRISGLSAPEEMFSNAMVTAVNQEDQGFAYEVRDWIYKHLKLDPTPVTKTADKAVV
jgi:hypothetical protein